MPAAMIAQYAFQLLSLLPSLIEAGQSVVGLVNQGKDAIGKMIAENREPTLDEWVALVKTRDDLHAQVQA
jgi:hypothetical protein